MRLSDLFKPKITPQLGARADYRRPDTSADLGRRPEPEEFELRRGRYHQKKEPNPKRRACPGCVEVRDYLNDGWEEGSRRCIECGQLWLSPVYRDRLGRKHKSLSGPRADYSTKERERRDAINAVPHMCNICALERDMFGTVKDERSWCDYCNRVGEKTVINPKPRERVSNTDADRLHDAYGSKFNESKKK